MKHNKTAVAVVVAIIIVLLAAGGISAFAQESHIGNVTGHANGGGQLHPDAGKQLYRRYCIGCHGPQGDGNGENATWIDPKPRDFTAAVFKCRSTPTGTLPTDDDLFNSVTRGFITTNMPAWKPLTNHNRADLVAYIKTYSARWKTDMPGEPMVIPAEPSVTIEGILHGRELYQKVECWKCHGPDGHGDGPSAPTLTDSKNNPIRPYDFSAGSRFKCGVTNQDLYRIFLTGLDGTPMPSFADSIKPADAWDLVHFLRTLQPLKTEEAATWKAWVSSHPGQLQPIGPADGPNGGQ